MQDVYKNIEKYNSYRKCNVLIVSDDITVSMIMNKKLNQIVTELYIRRRKLSISTASITQSCFAVPNDLRLNSKHVFIMENSKQMKSSTYRN